MNYSNFNRLKNQDKHEFVQKSLQSVNIRRYESRDRERIEEITRSSAMRGRPLKTYFEDERIVFRIFLDYYLQYEPESCFVAEENGQIIGHILGCKNTSRYLRVVLFRYGPEIFGRLCWKLFTGYQYIQTYRTLWWAIIHSWREDPTPKGKMFPGHLHLGIDQIMRKKGGATFYACFVKLVDSLITHFLDVGLSGAYAQVAEPGNQDFVTKRGCALWGFKIAKKLKFSLYSNITGDPWYIKLITINLTENRSKFRV